MLVSGMVIGTAFTLFVVPAIYMLVARVRRPATAEEFAGEVAADVVLADRMPVPA
jgi:hypothetical protein